MKEETPNLPFSILHGKLIEIIGVIFLLLAAIFIILPFCPCYVYGPAGLLAKRTTVDQELNTYFYHTDHLGSTRLVTDKNKNIVTAITYHLLGKLASKRVLKTFCSLAKKWILLGYTTMVLGIMILK